MPAEPPPPAVEAQTLLYQKGARIQPRRARGRFQKFRNLAMLVLLGAYYLTPWLQWGDRPLVWFDLPERRFYLAWLTLAPQDLFLLSLLLFVAAFTLFFFTSLGGRLWCGYACPQTVWTEAFVWIEHLVEGDRHARIKLDDAPWNARKVMRRGGKHLAWLVFAGFTGITFVAYFIPARQLFPAFATFDVSGWPLFWSLFYGFATWGNAGFMREQVCKYMCPYARFQSAMFDKDTLIIAYDQARGEPRKSDARQRGVSAGDCIDCSLCVQVCPVGIDIRKGLQYECIACASCVDVCNSVMDSVGKPRGLVRYSTSRRESGQASRFLRPRAIAYGLVWLIACAALATMVLTHSPLRLDVLRDRHALVRERADGSLENLYQFKITNADNRVRRFEIQARFDDGSVLLPRPARITVPAGETVAALVTLSSSSVATNRLSATPVRNIRVRISAVDDARLRAERQARFVTARLR
ncbi:MAG: cytochrome c oxidase accessory protein CcoG [Panacagrimonas sp.]